MECICDIENYFIAKNIMTVLKKEDFINKEINIKEVITFLNINNYDLAIINIGRNQFDYVLLEDLARGEYLSLFEYAKVITPEQRVDENASIVDIIEAFNSQYYLFVYDKNDSIKGIITYADLNRQPIQAYCYILISKLEQLLRETIKRIFKNESWLSKLNENGQKYIGSIYICEKAKLIERSLLECTTITHLFDILSKEKEWWNKVGFNSRNQFDSQMNSIIELRNSIMHNRGFIVTKDSGKDIYRLIQNIHHLIQNIEKWICEN